MPSAGTKKMHLAQLILPSLHTHSMVQWKHPRNFAGVYAYEDPELWRQVARFLEAARFDAVFLADVGGVFSEWEHSPDAAVQHAIQNPCFEPFVVASFMAKATRHLGLAVTSYTTGYHPYILARRLATLDHLSNGRVGWNVVTGFHHAAFQNLGIDEIPGHDERYDRAEEFLEICYGLWDSWDEDAVVLDREGDTFTDPSRVRAIDYRGQWYSSRGPLNVHRCPQGRPVILQAGASDRGRDFGAKHGEMIFAAAGADGGHKLFYEDFKSRMVDKYGRNPNDCKILFAFQPWVAETESIAREKMEYHNALATERSGLAWMSSMAGADLSPFMEHLDEPAAVLAGERHPEGLGGGRQTEETSREYREAFYAEPTVRDQALGTSRGFNQVCGSGTQVADWMEATMEAAGGDGFLVVFPFYPGAIEEFASMVVPELQRRGLYRTEYLPGGFRANLQDD